MKTRRNRKPVNVTLPVEVAEAARQHGLNLSATLERALVAELKERQRAAWRNANRSAIEAYNRDVEQHGLFGDAFRQF